MSQIKANGQNISQRLAAILLRLETWYDTSQHCDRTEKKQHNANAMHVASLY